MKRKLRTSEAMKNLSLRENAAMQETLLKPSKSEVKEELEQELGSSQNEAIKAAAAILISIEAL